MKRTFWTEARVAGALLASTFPLIVIAVIVLVLSGAIPGYRALIQGQVEQAAPHIRTLQSLVLLFISSWVVQLLGVGLLSRLLARAGAEQLAILAFVGVLITTVTGMVNFSFRMVVEYWSSQHLALGGSLPALYQPLREWTSRLFHMGYVLHYLSMIAVGWAILRTQLLSPSWGWATIGWSALWLLGGLVGFGIPAAPLLMPAAIGLGLMVNSEASEG